MWKVEDLSRLSASLRGKRIAKIAKTTTTAPTRRTTTTTTSFVFLSHYHHQQLAYSTYSQENIMGDCRIRILICNQILPPRPSSESDADEWHVISHVASADSTIRDVYNATLKPLWNQNVLPQDVRLWDCTLQSSSRHYLFANSICGNDGSQQQDLV